MFTFVQVRDTNLPAIAPWWMLLLRRKDSKTLVRAHQFFERHFRIRSGNDPHLTAAYKEYEKTGIINPETLQHPTILSAHWLITAQRMYQQDDVLINAKGGMRYRSDKALDGGAMMDSTDWPASFSLTRHINISTWGNHFYLVNREIAFFEKYNTEQAAMDHAKLFAPVENIKLVRVAKSFKDGD